MIMDDDVSHLQYPIVSDITKCIFYLTHHGVGDPLINADTM